MFTFIKRLTVLPLFLAIIIMFFIYKTIEHGYKFMRYGGEFTSYDSNNERQTIRNIYEELKKQRQDDE